MNRPTPDPSKEGSTRSSAPCQFPSWEGLVRGGFMVLMHGRKAQEAFHEPHEFQVHSPFESGGALPHSKTLARWLRGPNIRQVLECARCCGALDVPRPCCICNRIVRES